MKLKITLLLIFTFNIINSQIVNIPDSNFKNKLLAHNPVIDTNGDNEIQVSEASVFSGSLSVSTGSINDLTGIEAFTNISELNCGENNLTSLDLSSNINLITLYCTFNNISNLNLQNLTQLEYLDFESNQISSIDLSNKPALRVVIANHNLLTTLDTSSNNNLEVVYCGNNEIDIIDLSNATPLFAFYCSNNSTLSYINLKNGNNENISLTDTQTSNLPNLDTVCLDNVNSGLATQIENQITQSITITSNCSLSVSELINVGNTFIYPNPTENELTIKALSEISKVTIYNNLGQILNQFTNENGITEIELNNLKNGTYYVKLESGKQKVVKRIIKK